MQSAYCATVLSNPWQLLHEQTPIALFSACREAGVKRVVQVSALGVDKGIETAYFRTRRAPEAFLNALPDEIRWLILRPSVIYGEDGVSAKMFRLLAGLPIHILTDGGKQRLQPVHIDDICAAVNRWLTDPDAQSQTVACVGVEATDMRGMLDSYRQQMGHSKALHLSIPSSLSGFRTSCDSCCKLINYSALLLTTSYEGKVPEIQQDLHKLLDDHREAIELLLTWAASMKPLTSA